jgi:hypothetical protein
MALTPAVWGKGAADAQNGPQWTVEPPGGAGMSVRKVVDFQVF